MKFLVILLALGLIGLAVFFLARDLLRKLRGKGGCGDCAHCGQNSACRLREKEAERKKRGAEQEK